MFDNDWLTPEHKQQHLRSLNYAIAAAERGDEADEPVDLEFVPYLKRMNQIPWIVTNQCCTLRLVRGMCGRHQRLPN